MAHRTHSKDTPTSIPDEDYTKLKREILMIRVEALAVKKRKGKITDEDRKGWEKRFSHIAYTRPFLFYMATDVDRTPDISLAIQMIETMEQQRNNGDLSYKKSTHSLIHLLSDKLKFPEAKKWLPQEPVTPTIEGTEAVSEPTPEPEQN